MSSSSDSSRGTVWLRLAAVVAVVVVAGVAAGVVLDSEPGGDAVLDRVVDRYDSADSYASTVAVTVTVENESGTVERSGRARVLFSSPASYRVEVLAPERVNGTVAATNGSVAWVARPTGTTVVRSLNDTQQAWLSRVNLSATLDRFQANATVTRRGTATLDGVETHVLDVRPANESHDVNATVWVDTDDYDVRRVRTRATHDDRTVTATVSYESVSIGVSIHESTFQPPADRSVVLAGVDRTSYDSLAAAADNVSFEVRTADVPAGFTVAETLVSERGGDETLAVTYENETDRIAVVQSERNPLARVSVDTDPVSLGTANASYLRTRDTGVVFWRANGQTYAVAGTSDRDVLVGVAESLVR